MIANNPYGSRSAILCEDLFFGRRNELSALYTRLASNMSVALVGERRIGKSSLMTAVTFPSIQSEFDIPQNWRSVFIDSQFISRCTEPEFIGHLLARAAEQLDGFTSGPPSREALRDAFSWFERSGLKLTVLIDEFDVLTANENLTPDFFGFLRSLSTERRVPFVVAFKESNLDRLLRTNEIGSAFMNIFGALYVGPMNGEEAHELITVPASRLGVDFTAQEVEWVLGLTGYLPFYIQMACFHLFNARRESQHVDLEAIEELFILDASHHFRYLVSCLTPREQRGLKAFFSGRQADAQVLEQLLQKGVLLRIGQEMRPFSIVLQNLVEDELAATEEPSSTSLLGAAKAALYS